MSQQGGLLEHSNVAIAYCTKQRARQMSQVELSEYPVELMGDVDFASGNIHEASAGHKDSSWHSHRMSDE